MRDLRERARKVGLRAQVVWTTGDQFQEILAYSKRKGWSVGSPTAAVKAREKAEIAARQVAAVSHTDPGVLAMKRGGKKRGLAAAVAGCAGQISLAFDSAPLLSGTAQLPPNTVGAPSEQTTRRPELRHEQQSGLELEQTGAGGSLALQCGAAGCTRAEAVDESPTDPIQASEAEQYSTGDQP